ncbi:hypothetical protein Ancab_022402 [Ancistrocladus abbreviatus]
MSRISSREGAFQWLKLCTGHDPNSLRVQNRGGGGSSTCRHSAAAHDKKAAAKVVLPNHDSRSNEGSCEAAGARIDRLTQEEVADMDASSLGTALSEILNI